MAIGRTGKLRALLAGDDEGRLCKDIPEAACRHQSGNFVTHLLSLAATKTGDGLADPKLVLAWLLGALGAPAVAVGLLVPVRESLALLPQLFTSASIRSLPVRKRVWAAGSIIQGLCIMAMGVIALVLEGDAAGWAVVALLAIFAVARSVCSVSYKDVLGKTVSKQRRGSATGAAASVASALVLVFGILIALGVLPLTVPVIAGTLVLAGSLWIVAGLLFMRLVEEAGATEGGANALPLVFRQLSLLRQDGQLVRFIAVRGLLIATALAPPFLLALAGQSSDRSLTTLGPFVIASALASVLSSWVWGRFADRSSRWVLIASAIAGALVLGAAALTGLMFDGLRGATWIMSGALFIVMVSYQGVRIGRSTHLTDMADQDKRASYTALSNTAIGLLLLAGGLFGVLAQYAGVVTVLAVFALMCALAALLAAGLEEVQQA